MLARQRDHFARLHIADYHQGGIVRCIPALVPAVQILDRQLFEITHPADDGVLVGMYGEGGRHETFIGERLGLIVGAQTPLLHHHAQFLGEFLFIQHQVAHAVGFQLEGDGQTRFFKLLEIGGVINTGESVFASAVFGDNARELAILVCGGTFEHHVFENMRDTGEAFRLVTRPNLVPDLRHHHRCAMILTHHNLEAVLESGLLNRTIASGQQ